MPSGSTTAKPGYRSPYPSSELSEVEDFLTSGEDEHDRLPLSGKFPVEVLTLILDHLSFPDLYGSAQYVDKSWHYVATNLILGNHSFLERILDTDFDRLFQTCAGTLEDNYRSRNNAITLHNIGINAGELLSGQDAETWTGKSNKSLGLYCKDNHVPVLTTSKPILSSSRPTVHARSSSSIRTRSRVP